jgi:hypothetical protein
MLNTKEYTFRGSRGRRHWRSLDVKFRFFSIFFWEKSDFFWEKSDFFGKKRIFWEIPDF